MLMPTPIRSVAIGEATCLKLFVAPSKDVGLVRAVVEQFGRVQVSTPNCLYVWVSPVFDIKEVLAYLDTAYPLYGKGE